MQNLGRRAALTVALVAVVAAAASVTACSSSGRNGARSSLSATSDSLRQLLHASINSMHSARVSYAVDAAGTQGTLAGQVEYADGVAIAVDLTDNINASESLRVLLIHGTLYVEPPAGTNTTGTPWIKDVPNSTDPTIQQLGSLADLHLMLDLTTLIHSVDTARSISSGVTGNDGTHYSIVEDLSKLHDGPDEALRQAGLKTIPTEVWMDGDGYPIQVSSTYSVQGQIFQESTRYSNINSPVSIAEPPANEITTA